MRQCRWLELIKDYDCYINYHPDKADVVVDALSRKSFEGYVAMLITQRQIMLDLERLKVEVISGDS
jgi:hypothetical protein